MTMMLSVLNGNVQRHFQIWISKYLTHIGLVLETTPITHLAVVFVMVAIKCLTFWKHQRVLEPLTQLLFQFAKIFQESVCLIFQIINFVCEGFNIESKTVIQYIFIIQAAVLIQIVLLIDQPAKITIAFIRVSNRT